MSEDSNSNANATSDFSDRHVRMSSPHVGEVVVRDDREDLDEIEDTVTRLFDKLEESHEKNSNDDLSGGMYE